MILDTGVCQMKCVKAPCYYLLATLFFAMALNASPITIGVSGGVSASVCFPLFCAASPQLSQYQQIYASTAFSNPVYIESITFYVESSLNGDRVDSANLDISLSTTTSAISGLTTNLPANVTGTEVSFGNFTIPYTLSNPNSITFTGIPYLYLPSNGNLLLDVRIVSATANSHFTTLQVDTTGIVTQSAYAYAGGPAGPPATSTRGLVTT